MVRPIFALIPFVRGIGKSECLFDSGQPFVVKFILDYFQEILVPVFNMPYFCLRE
jgi:hypothetical protein